MSGPQLIKLGLSGEERVGNFSPVHASSHEIMGQESNPQPFVTDRNCEDKQSSLFVKFWRSFGHDERPVINGHSAALPFLASPTEGNTVTGDCGLNAPLREIA